MPESEGDVLDAAGRIGTPGVLEAARDESVAGGPEGVAGAAFRILKTIPAD